jgi:hypothetical protein
MKKILSIVMAIFMIVAMVGCSAAAPKDEMFVPNGGAAMDSVVSGNGAFGDGYYEKGEVAPEYSPEDAPTVDEDDEIAGEYLERKIVYTVATELQTKNFDTAMKIINDGIETHGGYIQSQKQTNSSDIYSKYSRRSLIMVVRIPSEKLESFLAGLQNESIYTLSMSKDSKDYSSVYYDKEMRIDTLKVQEERLLDMLSKANDLKTMLELEDRLSNIRYQIESLTKEMNIIDSNVNYSTVTIHMNEVVEYQQIVEEPATFFERIAEAFTESWADFADGMQDFAVWIVYSLPTILIIIIAVVVITVVVKTSKKRKVIKKTKVNNIPVAEIPVENDKKDEG